MESDDDCERESDDDTEDEKAKESKFVYGPQDCMRPTIVITGPPALASIATIAMQLVGYEQLKPCTIKLGPKMKSE